MSGPHRFAVLAAATLLVLATVSGPTMWRAPDDAAITGPYASLLAASTDLGPSRAADAQLTVMLSGAAPPGTLIGWADAHGLAVRWRTGDDWAIVTGPAWRLAAAFAVPMTTLSGDEFPGRPYIVFLTFVVVVGTLLLHGLTLPWLIRRLGVGGSDTQADALAIVGARTRAAMMRSAAASFMPVTSRKPSRTAGARGRSSRVQS